MGKRNEDFKDIANVKYNGGVRNGLPCIDEQ